MKMRVKAVLDIEVETDADGGTIGAREELAMHLEALLAPTGRVRFVELLPAARRLTVRENGAARYVGGCDYIPCDRRGKCLDGAACPDCAHAEVLARMALYEDALVARS